MQTTHTTATLGYKNYTILNIYDRFWILQGANQSLLSNQPKIYQCVGAYVNTSKLATHTCACICSLKKTLKCTVSIYMYILQ